MAARIGPGSMIVFSPSFGHSVKAILVKGVLPDNGPLPDPWEIAPAGERAGSRLGLYEYEIVPAGELGPGWRDEDTVSSIDGWIGEASEVPGLSRIVNSGQIVNTNVTTDSVKTVPVMKPVTNEARSSTRGALR